MDVCCYNRGRPGHICKLQLIQKIEAMKIYIADSRHKGREN